MPKYSRLLLIPSNGENYIYSFYVRDNFTFNVPQLYRINLPRLALDRKET